jgi:hypothetical protein
VDGITAHSHYLFVQNPAVFHERIRINQPTMRLDGDERAISFPLLVYLVPQ